GLEYVVLNGWGGNNSLMVGENKLFSTGNYVGKDFLKLFAYPLKRGDANTALKEPNSIVLTEATAIALFGEQDPMGQSVRLNNGVELAVTAILENLPGNSSFQFNYLIPFDLQYQTNS